MLLHRQIFQYIMESHYCNTKNWCSLYAFDQHLLLCQLLSVQHGAVYIWPYRSSMSLGKENKSRINNSCHMFCWQDEIWLVRWKKNVPCCKPFQVNVKLRLLYFSGLGLLDLHKIVQTAKVLVELQTAAWAPDACLCKRKIYYNCFRFTGGCVVFLLFWAVANKCIINFFLFRMIFTSVCNSEANICRTIYSAKIVKC